MKTRVAVLLLIPFLAALAPASAAPSARDQGRGAESTQIAGIVRDASGGVVTDALIVVRVASGAERQTVADAEGRFEVTPPAVGAVTVMVRAAGFAEWRRTIGTAEDRRTLEIVLEPAGPSEAVTVTPTRSEQRMGDVPASVSVIDRQQIRQSAAVSADDILRQLPSFSLFRRSSSLSAHPTSQGVSLRGIGPSGVSRTLVLLDGIPFNDAFGGWVYWTGLPIESAERIEVVDGVTSSLYGTYAMGGVINVVTGPAAPRTFEMRTQYGNLRSPKVDLHGSDVWGKVGVTVDASVFETEGYVPVVEVNPAGVAERGPIDNNANVRFRNVGVKLEYNPTDRVHAFVRSGYFREERDNGKISTFEPFTEEGNDTSWTYTSGGVRLRLPDSSDLQATVFTDFKTFRSNFMAVGAISPSQPRSIGRMTLNQRVPTKATGGMVQWSRAIAATHVISAGADWRWVDGDSEEDGLDPTTGTQVVRRRISGGTQRNAGVFVQDVFVPRQDLTITLSARVDRWRNYDGHNTLTTLATGAVDDPDLEDRQDTAISPRAGALYRLSERVSVWGDIGSGFRAPTLNELYRQFQVGTTVTLANNLLGPERLVGGEIGINVAPARNVTWRTTWFDNRVKDPVSNVTLSTVGANVTQQRQNLGRTRIWGVQTDAEYRLGAWFVSGAYLYGQAKVTENPANVSLVGNFLAQVPKHRGSVQVRYANPRLATIAVDIQTIGTQFDDDLNVRTVPGIQTPGLPRYTVVSLNVSRAISRNIEVFASAQNLFDREYFVGTLPTLVGPPRMVTGGVRVRFQGR